MATSASGVTSRCTVGASGISESNLALVAAGGAMVSASGYSLRPPSGTTLGTPSGGTEATRCGGGTEGRVRTDSGAGTGAASDTWMCGAESGSSMNSTPASSSLSGGIAGGSGSSACSLDTEMRSSGCGSSGASCASCATSGVAAGTLTRPSMMRASMLIGSRSSTASRYMTDRSGRIWLQISAMSSSCWIESSSMPFCW
ncbi:MAG: hypothetical protein IPN77_29730 [Sandaracinaceae bacterium]|nr:hypothetical protein [Sandaracinaceae bacterium]